MNKLLDTRVLTLLFITAFPVQVSACMIAHIFKVFPVGMSGDTIISVDIDIWRNGDMIYTEGDRKSSIIFDNLMPSDLGWDTKTYITKYDKYQNPIETTGVQSASRIYGRLYMKNQSYITAMGTTCSL